MKKYLYIYVLFICIFLLKCNNTHQYKTRRDLYKEVHLKDKCDGIICFKGKWKEAGARPVTRICNSDNKVVYFFVEGYDEERGLYHIVEIGDSVHKDTGTTFIYIYKPNRDTMIKYDLMTICDIWDSIEKRDREYSRTP